MKLKVTLKSFLILLFTLIFCEYIIYFIVIKQCSWPEIDKGDDENNTLKVMLLADTHLLGPFFGHWLDKLRREWQMHRAFQTAITLYQPEVVFILGDVFDEGQWTDPNQFKEYVDRFVSLFKIPNSTKIYVVPGNHDIGFHDDMYPYIVYRFEEIFKTQLIHFLSIKENYFILINSMALERDGCFFCAEADRKIRQLADNLKCIRDKKNCKKKLKLKNYSRPIILQHFPMYRKSDSECNERDEAPFDLKTEEFLPTKDCLSQSASEMIYKELNPRLIINGHVHHGCHLIHKSDIHEYTLPSFSWRNKNNPTFMLAKLTPTQFAVEKCDIPKESTVIMIYVFVILGATAFIVKIFLRNFFKKHSFLLPLSAINKYQQ